MEDSFKKCPYCAELILSEAIKCKHCGEMLEGNNDFWKNEPARRSSIDYNNKKNDSPGVAAVLSFLIPGAGQIYRGKIGKGIIWLISVILGYLFLVVPGIVLHIICVVNAYDSD